MVYKINYIKDTLGNNYIGIRFKEGVLNPFLRDLSDIVDNDDKYNTLVANQIRRDKREGYSHHITVLSVMEYNKLSLSMGSEFQNRLDIIFSLDLTDLELEGVGKAEGAGNITYFIVVNSPTLDEIRLSLGLEPKDFHITIGFDKKDVFGVRKNTVIKKKSKLTKLVDKAYSKYNGSHLWIFDVVNMDDNLKQVLVDRIELLDKTDTVITYRIDHTQIQISVVNDELRVATLSEYEQNKK